MSTEEIEQGTEQLNRRGALYSLGEKAPDENVGSQNNQTLW